MGLPPVLAGAVHDTLACAFAGLATTPVGAPGTVRGLTAAEAVEAGPVPAAFVAVTVKVYATPLNRPVMVHDVLAVVHMKPLGLDVAV
jgi:hypothetical protein